MERVIKVLLLAVLYVAVVLIVESLGMFINPYAWTYSAVPVALAAAWPYYKLSEQQPMPGIAILCAVLLLMVNFLLGQGHEFFALGCFAFGCIAEVLRKVIGNYRSRKGVIASYAAMALIPFSKTCVWWVDFDAAINMNIYKLDDIYYASTARMLDMSILIPMIIATLILAVGIMWILTRTWHPRETHHVVY